MILLSEMMIKKIDHLRRYSRINHKIRFVFIALISGWTWYCYTNGTFERHSYLIVALLLSTFIINIISDMLKSDMENILDAIEYDKSKIKYNSLDTKY